MINHSYGHNVVILLLTLSFSLCLFTCIFLCLCVLCHPLWLPPSLFLSPPTFNIHPSLFLSLSLQLPPCFQARLQRGNILLKQGNTQEAREDFETVVNLDA